MDAQGTGMNNMNAKTILELEVPIHGILASTLLQCDLLISFHKL